jgi:hypothetical protein
MHYSGFPSTPQFDMDLKSVINRFDHIVRSLGEANLYVHGQASDEGCSIQPALWMTDGGLAIYFAENCVEKFAQGPQAEDYDAEDELITVTFADGIRLCWLYQCLFILQSVIDCTLIWDPRRLYDGIMHIRRGWVAINENELRLHQNAVELSLVNACIKFRRLTMAKNSKTRSRVTSR